MSAVQWVSGKEVAAVVVLRPGGHVTLASWRRRVSPRPAAGTSYDQCVRHSVPAGRGPSNVLAPSYAYSTIQLRGGYTFPVQWELLLTIVDLQLSKV